MDQIAGDARFKHRVAGLQATFLAQETADRGISVIEAALATATPEPGQGVRAPTAPSIEMLLQEG